MKLFSILILLLGVNSRAEQCKGAMKGNLYWHTLPAELTIDDSVPFYMFNIIHEATKVWNDAVGYEILRITDHSTNLISQPKVWPHEPYQVGMTSTFYIFSYIRSVTIKFNINRTFNYRAVAIHELGHAIGLAHVEEPTDIMYNTSTDANVKANISKDNLDTIRCLYGVK